MIPRKILKTLFILSLSATFLLTMSGNGISLDKTKVDLSEYRGGNTNRTFIAYKYSFGNRVRGTLDFVYNDIENGFHLDWEEGYEDGTTQHLGFDYQVMENGLYETTAYHYVGEPGEEIELKYNYRTVPLRIPPDPPGAGSPNPLLVFPYFVVDVGYMWGDAFIEKLERETYGNFARVVQFAILGVEDVTVPAGTFTDCVKIGRFRGNQAQRIAWYAKGIGLVKMVYAQEEHIQLNIPGFNRGFVLLSYE